MKTELMGFADIIDVGLRGRTEPRMTPEFFLAGIGSGHMSLSFTAMQRL